VVVVMAVVVMMAVVVVMIVVLIEQITQETSDKTSCETQTWKHSILRRR